MAVISLYLDKRKKTSKEIYPIKFRVYHNSAFFISTGMYASPEVWDGKAYNRKELNYKVKNVSLSNKFNKLESKLLFLLSLTVLYISPSPRRSHSADIFSNELSIFYDLQRQLPVAG